MITKAILLHTMEVLGEEEIQLLFILDLNTTRGQPVTVMP
jgi:hypothetical protein